MKGTKDMKRGSRRPCAGPFFFMSFLPFMSFLFSLPGKRDERGAPVQGRNPLGRTAANAEPLRCVV
jgi:hypothetical protein